jgi:hypothetical protein
MAKTPTREELDRFIELYKIRRKMKLSQEEIETEEGSRQAGNFLLENKINRKNYYIKKGGWSQW